MSRKSLIDLVRIIANRNWGKKCGFKWKAGANNTYRWREKLGRGVYLHGFYPDIRTWFQNGGSEK